MFREARSLARDGHCDSVRELEGRIAEHDRPYHDGVFVLDPAIAECLR